MKRLLIILTFFSLGMTSGYDVSAKVIRGGDGVYFYSALNPYGIWIEISNGVTVWRPANVSNNWAPYRDGYWIWTDDGWYWETYESFGYITYHYGRWYNDDYYGWIWIPDDQWAPAWVEWRYDDDYIGWAPLSPYAGFSIGIGIQFSNGYETHYRHWNFVRYRNFCNIHVYNHFVAENFAFQIYKRTKYRTNYGYSNGRVINRGVNIDFVRKRSAENIRERKIERVTDLRELRNNNDRNSNTVRSYVVDRENIRRERTDDRNISRGEGRSSLDMNKIITRNRSDNNIERNKFGVSERDRSNENTDIRNRTRENTIDSRDKMIRERKDNRRMEPQTEIRKKPEVKREERNRRNTTQFPVIKRETQTQQSVTGPERNPVGREKNTRSTSKEKDDGKNRRRK